MSAEILLHGRNGASTPIALQDMDVLQLTEAAGLLDEAWSRYDKLSGICTIMHGLVLAEVKRKLEHGKWIPWLAEHFGKSRKTAAQNMRLAAEFCKCNPRVTFEILGRDLAQTVKELEQAQIDLRHPLVREVARWVGERTRYQLLLDFPGDRGGDTSGSRKKLSPEEEHAKFLEDAREDFVGAINSVESLRETGFWKMPSIRDAELEAAAEALRELAREVTAWLKKPRRERMAAIAEEAANR